MPAGRKRRARVRLSDPLIVPRVRKYLTDNVDKTFIDVDLMARALRDYYHEYSKLNQASFYLTVEAAYNVVLQSYGLAEGGGAAGGGAIRSSGTDSESDDDSDDLEVLEDPAPRDALNDRLALMYQAKKPKRDRKEIDKDSELIDISSDDGSDESSVPKSLKFNNEITISSAKPPPAETPTPEPVVVDTPKVNSKPEISPEEPPSKRKKTEKKKVKIQQKSITEPELKYASKFSFNDIGGIDHIIEQICDLVLHMRHPEVYAKLGIKAPRGALLHGPPGTGKTLLANAIAGQLKLPIISTVATELVGGMSGESEKLIRETFETASSLAPCILFIDEIDSICGNRLNAQKDMERRMVSQLLSSIDSLDENNTQVLLLAATNNPDSLDPGLRRAGRLEQEIPLGIPTLSSRKDILRILCRNLNLDSAVDLNTIAQFTPGYVGADLQALINKACTIAVKRVFKYLKENAEVSSSTIEKASDIVSDSNESAPIIISENGDASNTETSNGIKDDDSSLASIEDKDDAVKPADAVEVVVNTQPDTPAGNRENHVQSEKPVVKSHYEDLQKYIDDKHPFTDEQLSDMKIMHNDIILALKTTRPCAIREGFVTVPDTTWDDIGSLIDVRRELQLAVLAPVKYPDQLEALGLTIPSGVLLCGPPGCGKTLLAKAVANEAGINFISVKGPELLNMYVGESERAVRTCFSRAKNSAPCVIFFDEFDSLCPKRVNSDTSGATRVVNQLLTEMDGVEGREGVFILAASNRPDIIDPAVLRPGRLDRILFVGMPQLQSRVDILRAITKKGTKPPMNQDVDLEEVAKASEGFTGADLAGLVRQASTQALTDFITGNLSDRELSVSASHFKTALAKTRPSVSAKEMQHYEKLKLKYATSGEEKNDVEMDTSEVMDTV